jgi:hypothetical protein
MHGQDDTDAIKLAGVWKEFNEVDRYQMPRTKKTVRLVPRGLVALAMSAGFAVIPDKAPYLGPCVFTLDESQCMVLSKMAREYVSMLML